MYGAGLARLLHDQGVEMIEVDRPDRKARRFQGKSDPIDAIAAARTALAGVRSGRRFVQVAISCLAPGPRSRSRSSSGAVTINALIWR